MKVQVEDANIPEMWSFDFWRQFIDEMARHRFNVLTLWNLHPFPSLVKVPEFPDLALDNVMRTPVPADFRRSPNHGLKDQFKCNRHLPLAVAQLSVDASKGGIVSAFQR